MDYNEEIKRENRRRSFKMWLTLPLASIVVLGAGFIYALLFTDILRFNEVELLGATTLTSEEIFGVKNPYLFQNVLTTNPLVADFSVNKNFFRKKLSLNITERTPFAVWCAHAESPFAMQCFWIDEGGLLFSVAPASEGSLVRSVYDFSGKDLKLGDRSSSPEYLTKIFDIFSISEKAGIRVTKYSLLSFDTQEFHALTSEGVSIYFNLRIDQAFTLEPLVALKEKLGELEYIDLRSENRVFYK